MDVEEGGALSADHGLLLCGTERPGFETLAGGGGVVRTAAWFSISQLFKIPCAKPRNLEEQVSDTLGSGGGGGAQATPLPAPVFRISQQKKA